MAFLKFVIKPWFVKKPCHKFRMSDEELKREEIEERRIVQEAVRTQTVRTRQHVRSRVTKLCSKIEDFQREFPGDSAEEPVAFAQLTAMYKSLEPIANQLKKLDGQFLDTFHHDF